MSDRDRGSALLLLPGAFLSVLFLGSLTVDAASLFLQQRAAYNLAYDAANDAVSLAVDRASVSYVPGETLSLHLDPDRAHAVVAQTIERAGPEGPTLVAVEVDGTRVSVTVRFEPRPVLGLVDISGGPAEITAAVTGTVTMPDP